MYIESPQVVEMFILISKKTLIGMTVMISGPNAAISY